MDPTKPVDVAARAQAQRYLAALRVELADVPRARRREIVAGIREHIDDAFGDAAPVEEATAVEILNHLGSPRDIALTARAELGTPSFGRPSGLDLTAVLFLLLGGPLGHALLGTSTAVVVGWLIGVVLLWASPTWRRRDKILGTLVVPLGLGVMAFAGRLEGDLDQAAQSHFCEANGTTSHCGLTAGIPQWATVTIYLLYLVLGLLGPLFTAFWLTRQARRRPSAVPVSTARA